MDLILILVISLCVISGLTATGIWIYYLAKIGKFFVLIPGKNEVVAVMVGGQLEKYISTIDPSEGYVDTLTGEIVWKKLFVGIDPATGKDIWSDNAGFVITAVRKIRGYLSKKTGIYFMSFIPWATPYKYKFSWNKYAKKKPEDTAFSAVPKSEEIRSIYAYATYVIEQEGVETMEQLPLNLSFFVRIRLLNANVALFQNKTPDWLGSLTAATNAQVRSFVGSDRTLSGKDGYTWITETDHNDSTSEFRKIMFALNDTGIREKTGVEIVEVHYMEHEVSGSGSEKEALAKATTAAYVAGEQAKVTIKTANATAHKIQVEGKAVADALKLRTDAVGKENIATIAMAEAIEKTKASTVVIGGNAATIVGGGSTRPTTP